MHKIWFNKDLDLENLRGLAHKGLAENLGIEFLEIGSNFLSARMPVNERTRQPYGLLHGGASVALAETLGSVASHFVVDHTKFLTVGLEINANHIRNAKEGFVTGTCRPLHIGRSTHVWDIQIVNEVEKLICVSRLTVAIIPKPAH